MASCTLRLELDGTDNTYARGDTVRGIVHVSVPSGILCNGLYVRMQWHAEHRVESSSGRTDSERLFFGRWEPGEHAYPFSIVVPQGPASYRGELFRITWTVRADAVLPMTLDPSTSCEVEIVRGTASVAPDELQKALSRDRDSNIRVESEPRISWLSAVLVVLVLIGFGCVAYTLVQCFTVRWFNGELILPIFLGFMGAIFGGIPLAMLIIHHRQYELAKNLGWVDYVLSTTCVAPGGDVECKVAFTPKHRAVKVGPIRATLHAHERVSARRHDDEYRGESNLVHKTVLTLCEAQTVEAGTAFSAVGTFKLPEDAPCTISAKNHGLDWEVLIDAEIAEKGFLRARRGLLVG